MRIKLAALTGLALMSSTAWGLGTVAVVAGGSGNTAEGNGAAVVGGYFNTAAGDVSFIGGGQRNSGDLYGTVGGGAVNAAGQVGTIGGGAFNNTGLYGTVGGGAVNNAGAAGTVGGGVGNNATGPYSSILGGRQHNATGILSTVIGGRKGTASTTGSMALVDSQDVATSSPANDQLWQRFRGGIVNGGQVSPGSVPTVIADDQTTAIYLPDTSNVFVVETSATTTVQVTDILSISTADDGTTSIVTPREGTEITLIFSGANTQGVFFDPAGTTANFGIAYDALDGAKFIAVDPAGAGAGNSWIQTSWSPNF